MDKVITHSKKVLIGIIGGIVTLIGFILVPYPGPGWLVVFGGLAILATEFEFASKILTFARGKYDAWVEWVKRQPWYLRILVLGATGLVVLATLWLINALAMVGGWLGFEYHWLTSPFFR